VSRYYVCCKCSLLTEALGAHIFRLLPPAPQTVLVQIGRVLLMGGYPACSCRGVPCLIFIGASQRRLFCIIFWDLNKCKRGRRVGQPAKLWQAPSLSAPFFPGGKTEQYEVYACSVARVGSVTGACEGGLGIRDVFCFRATLGWCN